MIDTILRVYRLVNKAIEWLSLGLILIMTAVTMYRVSMRYFFDFTPSWTEELSCILMIWLAFLGFALGVRERMHLKISLFSDLLGTSARKFLTALFTILQACAGLYLILAGVRLSIDQFHTTMSAVKIFPFAERLMPNSILYIVVPVAGLMIVIYSLIQLLDCNDLFRMHTLKTGAIDATLSGEEIWE